MRCQFGQKYDQGKVRNMYLTDGRIEMDNNLVENAIRPTALGKKNWLFVGEAQAGERIAILYTLGESCRRRRLDPYTYPRGADAPPRMTNWQISEVTPEAWGKTQRALQRQAAL